MTLVPVDSVDVDHFGDDRRRIDLLIGHLSDALPLAADFALVLIEKGDYSVRPGTVSEWLANAKLSLDVLSKERSLDLPSYSSWVSPELGSASPMFRRLLVLEVDPPFSTHAPRSVWKIFQALQVISRAQNVSTVFPLLISDPALAGTMFRMAFFAAGRYAGVATCPLGTTSFLVPEAKRSDAERQFVLFKKAYLNAPLTGPRSIDGVLVEDQAARQQQIRTTLAWFDPSFPRYRPRPSGVTERQILVVGAWTTAFYRGLQRVLTSDDLDSEDFVYFQPTIEALSTALANLPNYFSTEATLRGVRLDTRAAEIEEYERQGTITHVTFTSTSRTRAFEGDTLLKTYSISGKRLNQLSLIPEEDEVLFDQRMTDKVIYIEGARDAYKRVFYSAQVEKYPLVLPK